MDEVVETKYQVNGFPAHLSTTEEITLALPKERKVQLHDSKIGKLFCFEQIGLRLRAIRSTQASFIIDLDDTTLHAYAESTLSLKLYTNSIQCCMAHVICLFLFRI